MESHQFDTLVTVFAARRPRRAALPALAVLGLGLAEPPEMAARNKNAKKVRVCNCASADVATCRSQKKAKDKAKKLLRRNACAYKGPCQGVSGCVAGGPGGGTCVPIQSPCPAGCTAGRACAGCCPTNSREPGFCFDSINGGCPTNAPCC